MDLFHFQGKSFNITTLGKCVISSVLSHHSKKLKWQTTVTACLQLSFTWQAKDSTPLRQEGGSTPKKRPQSILTSTFYTLVPPLSMSYVGELFASPEVLTPVLRFFVPSLQAFSFLCLLATAILDSFYLF